MSRVVLNALRQRRQVQAVYCLGSRAVGELIDEIGRHHGITADIDRRLARYAAIDPEMLRAVGGNRWPIAPLCVVCYG
jgi:hypothetical protein